MNFLENILQRLEEARESVVLEEAREGQLVPTTATELLHQVAVARGFLRGAGLRRGDRCALLAHNSARWVALDLALMAEGAIVVPLYARQAPAELVGMLKDSGPTLVCCGDTTLR
ncbi:MAG: AMP-binding protein, partial [Terriglobales bacterium]